MSNSSSSSSLSDVALSWLSEDEDVMAADDDPDEPELACSSSSSDVSTMLDTMLGSSFAVLLLAPFSQRCLLRAAWLLSRNAGMAAAWYHCGPRGPSAERSLMGVSTMLDTMLGSSFAVLLLAPFSQRCFLRAAWLLSRNSGMAAAWYHCGPRGPSAERSLMGVP